MNGQNAEIIDLPGIYSLYAKSKDEQIAFEVLYDKKENFVQIWLS